MKTFILSILFSSSAFANQFTCTPCAVQDVSQEYHPASYLVIDGGYDNLIDQVWAADQETCENLKIKDSRCQ